MWEWRPVISSAGKNSTHCLTGKLKERRLFSTHRSHDASELLPMCSSAGRWFGAGGWVWGQRWGTRGWEGNKESAFTQSTFRISNKVVKRYIYFRIISPKSKGDVMVAIKGDRVGMGNTSSYHVLLSLGISVRRENLIKWVHSQSGNRSTSCGFQNNSLIAADNVSC